MNSIVNSSYGSQSKSRILPTHTSIDSKESGPESDTSSSSGIKMNETENERRTNICDRTVIEKGTGMGTRVKIKTKTKTKKEKQISALMIGKSNFLTTGWMVRLFSENVQVIIILNCMKYVSIINIVNLLWQTESVEMDLDHPVAKGKDDMAICLYKLKLTIQALQINFDFFFLY